MACSFRLIVLEIIMSFTLVAEVHQRYPILQSEIQYLKAIHQFQITIDHYTCLVIECQISW